MHDFRYELVGRFAMTIADAPTLPPAQERSSRSKEMVSAGKTHERKKVLWQELLRHELLTALEQQPVVIVPVGSVEQHGPHCPQDVDISIPYHLAIKTADAIDDFPVIVAPPVTYGFTHYNMGEVGTISLALETFIAVLCDVSRSIWANGFHRIILLNGHGGNEQPTWAAAVKLAEEDVWPVALTYWKMAPDELRPGARPTRGVLVTVGSGKRVCSFICGRSWSTPRGP